MNKPIDNAYLAILIANNKTNYNLLIDAERQALLDYVNALLNESINTLIGADAAVLLDKEEYFNLLDTLESGLLIKTFFLVFNGCIIPKTIDEALSALTQLMIARDKIEEALTIMASIHTTLNRTKALLEE
jgi:hypothetical protein